MKPLIDFLQENRIFPGLQELLAPDACCYLIGGAVRDWLLGKPSADFDFATPDDPSDLARRFAVQVEGSRFWLDKGRRQSRVVARIGDRSISYDFAPFRAETLEGDLSLRDFTVNAVALSIEASGMIGEPVDPLGGRDDLRQGILRCCSPSVFEDDPLRVLRGVRHAVTLGLDIEEDTRGRMGDATTSLARIATERLRNELALILASNKVTAGLGMLDELGVFPVLFGEASTPGSTRSAIEQVRLVEQAYARVFQQCRLPQATIDSLVDDGFSARALLCLGAFLHGYHPRATDRVVSGTLRMSRKNAAILKSLESLALGADAEGLPQQATRRGRALWAASLGPAPFLALCFLLALGGENAPGLETVARVICDYHDLSLDGRIADLVDGQWLTRSFGWPPGPKVGRALERLRREEVQGRVRTVEEAHKFLKSLAEKNIDKRGDPA